GETQPAPPRLELRHGFVGDFPNFFITSCRSAHACFFSSGERSRYAGWNVGISGTPSYSFHCPRRRVIGVPTRSSVCAANLPSATITFGRIEASCAFKNGSHASISSGSGFRLFGGRHFTTLQM